MSNQFKSYNEKNDLNKSTCLSEDTNISSDYPAKLMSETSRDEGEIVEEEKNSKLKSHYKLNEIKDFKEIKKVNLSNLNEKNEENYNLKIDSKRNRFPFCIVWTQLPLISFLFPFIGHTGICDSKGYIYDFAGSRVIGEEELSFGDPAKYVQFKPIKNWDKAIDLANVKYSDEDHCLCTNNCHSHVACALNYMKYKNKSNYTMIHVWWYCLLNSKYVSWGDIFKTYFGWIFMFLVYALVKILSNSK